MKMSYLRKTVDTQIHWSNKLDSLLPEFLRIDGNQNFIHEFVTPYLTPDALIYDVGGGKQPMIPVATKQRLRIRVVGVDIDQKELGAAPAGAYDATVCCDITKYRG